MARTYRLRTLPTCLRCNGAECTSLDTPRHANSGGTVCERNDDDHSQLFVWTLPATKSDRLRNRYVHMFDNGQLRARFWLMTGKFDQESPLALIPQRLGESKALDSAVRCICDSNKSSDRIVGDKKAAQSYTSALQSLQAAIQDPLAYRRAETLAAASILYYHEIYLSPWSEHWTVHAKGIVQLLQLRGPNGIQNDLERFILLSNMGTIFIIAVESRQPCFLAEPDWSKLLLETTVDASKYRSYRYSEALKRMVLASVHIPGLLCRYEVVASAPNLDSLEDLMQDLREIRTQLQTWRHQYEGEGPIRTFEKEVEEALRMPVISAYRLTAAVFVIVSDYMLANLENSYNQAQSMAALPSTENYAIVNDWTMLASNAKTKWLALKQLDLTSARACASAAKAVIRWALEPSGVDTAKVWSIRLVLQDLYQCLKP